MRYFPTFIDLEGRSCLVVGGGAAALAKIRLLLKTPAKVTVISADSDTEIRALRDEGVLNLVERSFLPSDVRGYDLVYVASGERATDEMVSSAARAAGVAINAVDQPELSSFITPAIVDRDPLLIGVSSAGAAPVLARQIRTRIEAMLPARLGRLAAFARSFRPSVKSAIAGARTRRRFWEDFFASPLARRIAAGEEKGTRQEMLALVNGQRRPSEGAVAIVGAGPGDPDLLTLKALDRLQQADVVIYDRLVAPEIVDYARRDAERIFAGKARGLHTLTQNEINYRMLHAAKAGKRVVRLKGGDPFVFGRGGEEKAFLEAHGCNVELVPGITAAAGCAAAAGIPLTERGVAQAVTFVTGQGANGEPDLDWASLARLKQTLCIYMGVSTANSVALRLIEGGLAPTTPTAIIENGTRNQQRVLRGPLAQVGAIVEREAVTGPAIIMIGEVASAMDEQRLTGTARAIAV